MDLIQFNFDNFDYATVFHIAKAYAMNRGLNEECAEDFVHDFLLSPPISFSLDESLKIFWAEKFGCTTTNSVLH